MPMRLAAFARRRNTHKPSGIVGYNRIGLNLKRSGKPKVSFFGLEPFVVRHQFDGLCRLGNGGSHRRWDRTQQRKHQQDACKSPRNQNTRTFITQPSRHEVPMLDGRLGTVKIQKKGREHRQSPTLIEPVQYCSTNRLTVSRRRTPLP